MSLSVSDTGLPVLACPEGRSSEFGLPGQFYRSEEIHAQELELLFYREWLFAAHTAELDTPGSYLTLQIGDYPVLLVRGRDGAIRAFLNTCRHRGARICPEERGVVPKLVCPYHQWTYELDGRLFAARLMGADFDPCWGRQ